MLVLSLHTDKHYKHKYIEEHGLHFTEDLAKEAVSHMVNANGDTHVFTMAFINQWLLDHNIAVSLLHNSTLGDIYYAANMAYADFFPEIIKEPGECVKFAVAMAKDVDGYEGLIFARWLSDCKHKDLKIDWKKYI